jgi:starvation-inducible DNA-binding protein
LVHLHIFPCGAAVARETVNFQVASSNLAGGVWAINSAVECAPYKCEVTGSNPVSPIIINTQKKSIMETLYKLLSDTQASLFVLFQKTWVYHWNVVGDDFKQFHDLFGEQYEAMFEEIDRMTEHMRYLNIKPVPTLSRVTEVSHISEANSGLDTMGMVRDLLEGHQKIVDLLNQVSEEAENQKSKGTINLVDDLNEAHGKHIWMLRSFTQ